MNTLAKPLALLALLATIVPPALFMLNGVSNDKTDVQAASAATGDQGIVDDESTTSDDGAKNAAVSIDPGMMTQSRMQNIMLAAAILWFVSAPAWLKESD